MAAPAVVLHGLPQTIISRIICSCVHCCRPAVILYLINQQAVMYRPSESDPFLSTRQITEFFVLLFTSFQQRFTVSSQPRPTRVRLLAGNLDSGLVAPAVVWATQNSRAFFEFFVLMFTFSVKPVFSIYFSAMQLCKSDGNRVPPITHA